MKKTLAIVLCLALMMSAVSIVPALAEEAAAPVAYIMYADSAWANQFWYDGNEYPVKATTAEITGAGEYTVGLEFNEEAQGLAFTALGITDGEILLPGYTIELKAIRVNGEEIAFEKGYTSSDNGVETRMNIYNEWVSEVPKDARSFDGKTDDAKPVIVDKELFAAVKTFEIDFAVHQFGVDTAYIMFADASPFVDITDLIIIVAVQLFCRLAAVDLPDMVFDLGRNIEETERDFSDLFFFSHRCLLCKDFNTFRLPDKNFGEKLITFRAQPLPVLPPLIKFLQYFVSFLQLSI